MLESGSPAPQMVLEDTAGQTISLADFEGEHPVLIYFMRSTSCPVCNRHVKDLVDSREAFAAADVRVLIAVPEGRERAAAWQERRRIPYPVLTAREGTPHELIGLGRKAFGSMQQSGSLLVDVQGVVRHAHAATMPTGGYDKQGITAAIASLGTRA